MTSYSIFAQTLPAGTSSGNDDATWEFGIQFQVTASGYQLTGYWWYLPATGNTDATQYTFSLYSTSNGTSGTLVSGSTVTASGTWVQGAWNFVPLASPVALSNGTTYVAVNSIAVTAGAAYQFLHSYWSTGAGSGGLTDGPVTAPGTASALGAHQQPFNEPGSASFPSSVFEDSFYGIDINVTAAATPVSDTDTGSGADTGTVAASTPGADAGTSADSATVTASVPGADAGAGADSAALVAAAPGADGGAGADMSGITAAAPGADTASATEAGSLGIPAADTGAGADTASLTAAVPGSDTASGADTGRVSATVQAPDAGTAAEQGVVSIPPPVLRAQDLGGTAQNANDYGGTGSNANDYGGSIS